MQMRLFNPIKVDARKGAKLYVTTTKGILDLYESAVSTVVIGDALFSTESTDPIMVLRMKFFSVCEHHLLPFFGECSIAYIPNGKILGLSKIPKLVDLFAQRLQVQEDLTHQIGTALQEAIKPKGIAVLMSATHLCAVMRNLQDYDSPMITSFRRGLYKDSPELYNEFSKAALQNAKN